MITEARSTDFPAVTSDYLPTILDILDAELDDERPIDGVSLLPIVQGKESPRARPIGFQSKGQVALSDNQYKLYRPKANSPWELYDLLADPSEQNDLAKSLPAIVEEMSSYVVKWQSSCAESNEGADYSQ